MPGTAICCVAIANISRTQRLRLGGLGDDGAFHSIVRPGSSSGSYFVSGGLANLEELNPLGTDSAGHSCTTCLLYF